MPKSRKLQARREAARLHDEQRQWTESAIAKLEKRGATDEEIARELDLEFVDLSPALEFICDYLNKPDADNYDAIEALLDSDVPLTRSDRLWIRSALHSLRFPTSAAQQRNQTEQAVFESLREYYKGRGESAPMKRAANALGWNVEALKKRRQRSRKVDKKA